MSKGEVGNGGERIEVQGGKVISFKPRVGKAQTGPTSSGFTVIIPFYIKVFRPGPFIES